MNSKYPMKVALCRCGCPQGQQGKSWGGIKGGCDGEVWPHLSRCRAGHSVPAALPSELSPCSLSASSSLSFSPAAQGTVELCLVRTPEALVVAF